MSISARVENRRLAVKRRTPSKIWLTKRVSVAEGRCMPWFSVQPMGIKTISFLRRSSINL